jgi:hypothetical protein
MMWKGCDDMGKVTVELFEYALFINHADGLTVIFPEPNHVLVIESPTGTLAVTRGANMEMMGPGGVELPASKPTELPGYGQYVLDLQAAMGQATAPVAPSLYDPLAAVDPTVLNGRLLLKGGRIDGRPCSDPAKRVKFNFRNGQFTVTDTAVFEMDIPDREVVQLRINGAFIDVEDGTTIRIRNSDGLGCPRKDFAALDEMVTLSALGGYNTATAPMQAGSRISAQGGTNICANAKVSTSTS